MTSKRIAQNNQQQKSDKPQGSGILQRATVRSVADAGVRSIEDNEAQGLSNSAFSKDFSQVPISTTQPQPIMAKLMLSQVVQQMTTPASVQSGEGEAIQRQEMSEGSSEGIGASGVQKKNKTGLPDNLKVGIENLSRYSLDDVRVHYNSSKPADLQAFAYTQGTDIHVAPGQEQHLPHEAWHVVQQKQGRVKPSFQLKGEQVNDDEGLEHEADIMGAKAVQMRRSGKSAFEFPIHQAVKPIQLYNTHEPDANNLGTKITTINGLYYLKEEDNNKELYARNNVLQPRSSRESGQFMVNNIPVKKYIPATQFIADCLHTAEEIMQGQQLDLGQVRSREATTQKIFGNSVLGNWQAARAAQQQGAVNINAASGLGNAYAITTRYPKDIGQGVRCQYHAAAVVAVDGTDHITLEIFGNPEHGNRNENATYNIYDSNPGSNRTFHDGWINTFKDGITISINPIP